MHERYTVTDAAREAIRSMMALRPFGGTRRHAEPWLGRRCVVVARHASGAELLQYSRAKIVRVSDTLLAWRLPYQLTAYSASLGDIYSISEE